VYSVSEKQRGETVRENREYYSSFAVGCVSSFCWIIEKEGLAVWGGRSPNWVNHVYLCLSCFVRFLCLYFCNILCVPLLRNI